MKIDPFGQASMHRPQLLHIVLFIRIVPFNGGSPALYDMPHWIMKEVSCQIIYTINLPARSKFHQVLRVGRKNQFLSLKTRRESVRRYACGRYLEKGEPFHFSWSPLFSCLRCSLPTLLNSTARKICKFSAILVVKDAINLLFLLDILCFPQVLKNVLKSS